MDLSFTTPLEDMNVCDVAPQFGSWGVADARRIAPGAPNRSVLLRRIRTKSFNRMPPLGTSTIDPQGTAVVEEWIKQLSCTNARSKI